MIRVTPLITTLGAFGGKEPELSPDSPPLPIQRA